jgi:hypothetical protein
MTDPVPGLIIALLLLHGPTGREIRINPRNVTSLHAPTTPGHNQVVVKGANCLVNTTDGKFISVVETCADVARMIGEPK